MSRNLRFRRVLGLFSALAVGLTSLGLAGCGNSTVAPVVRVSKPVAASPGVGSRPSLRPSAHRGQDGGISLKVPENPACKAVSPILMTAILGAKIKKIKGAGPDRRDLDTYECDLFGGPPNHGGYLYFSEIRYWQLSSATSRKVFDLLKEKSENVPGTAIYKYCYPQVCSFSAQNKEGAVVTIGVGFNVARVRVIGHQSAALEAMIEFSNS